MKNKQQFILALVLVVLAAGSRLVPHAMNFTPITALALFSAYAFSGKWKLIIPFLAIILSDIALELTTGYGFHSGTVVVYLAFALMIGVGYLLLQKLNIARLVGATLLSSVLFFLITNFAFFYPESPVVDMAQGHYPHNFVGILASYKAGLPFFKNMLVGDVVFTLFLFGVHEFTNQIILKNSRVAA
ncbi:hypothetical protein LAG90_02920 [Marinilongibacter aquaticus]|uniref:DUF6580 family putative transport protein n=1 Tax=Marinilongibacter aquaticus TaxID=2975157 RepID=UPI0021BD0471|nr:DUF6580 family putative transport protein [Marinilongibacter aquaticus]UBM59603.1 hypothetical protein LAG90_02920 [Marinilongibacter aquaticus]